MYQKAFTLIEVLMVLIIIAILATMAFMTYQGYVVRTQLAEVFQQAGAYRTQFIASDQPCDAGRQIGGRSQYIEKVIINAACRIEFKMRQQGVDTAIRGKSLAFDVYSGKCYSTDIQQRYLPKDCQGQ
ncbi:MULTISPECIES: prepilin-type N-terminal cleavage/methylation domain-containing protein [unclassified Acinetobacter]|uniref:prepilin-type N-terminal cleavage/methylation domain-containing protein n=1 Tax=unclassified Acinetobacter TaxID=196816 RepID=UPI001C23A025|nr:MULTISPECIES: prepilin-type N-terminal cleavage/methylation domain-containing protein [unclassified Acinetobacter]